MAAAAEINRQRVMQLATEKDGQPWACTVYFVLHEGCFYWLSYPERRHSGELAVNPRAAIAIAIEQALPVVGLQSEGEVAVVKELREIETVLALYVKKYGSGKQFVQRYKDGTNRHVLYRFVPRKTVLFDERNYSEEPQREIDPTLLS